MKTVKLFHHARHGREAWLTINDENGSHTHSYHHGQAVFTQWMSVLKFVDSACRPPPSRHLAGLRLMTLNKQRVYLDHISVNSWVIWFDAHCCQQSHLRNESSFEHQEVSGHDDGVTGTGGLSRVVEELQRQRSLTLFSLTAQHRLPSGDWRFRVQHLGRLFRLCESGRAAAARLSKRNKTNEALSICGHLSSDSVFYPFASIHHHIGSEMNQSPCD